MRSPPETRITQQTRRRVPARPIDSAGESDSPSLTRAVVSGFIASAVMLLAFAAAYGTAWLSADALLAGRPTGGVPTDVLGRWLHGLTDNVLIDHARPNLAAAVALYFVGGLFWAALYAYVARPRLRGAEWRRGLLFALAPWLFSLVVFLPLVGGGPFGFALGAGPLPIVGNLVLHAVYGATLATIYGPLWDVIPDRDSSVPTGADARANRGAQTGTAAGLLLGLTVGGAAGLASGGLVPGGPDAAATVLAASLLGGALGALTGSFAGLSASQPRA